jgi:hypothetical protein
MRPSGFDSSDLRRCRSGLTLSKVSKHRVEAAPQGVATQADFSQAAAAWEKSGLVELCE